MITLEKFYPRHCGMGATDGKKFYLYIPKAGSTSEKNTYPEKDINIIDFQHAHSYTIIRNPYTRIISSYFEYIDRVEYMSFDDFLSSLDTIEDVHIIPQTDFIEYSPVKIQDIYIMETYDFKYMYRITAPKEKQSLLNRMMYCSKTRSIVEKHYKDDIELYKEIAND